MKENVVIVEDSDLNRAILVELLKDKYDIIECVDGETAVEIIKNTSDIVLVLLDLILPTMSGIDVLKALSAEEKELKPILVISASSNYDDQREAFLNGAFDYIVKPFDIKHVSHRIETAIYSKNRLVELQKQLEIERTNADYDWLTKVYSRKKAETLIKEHITTHPYDKYGLLIFDLDNFKLINDLDGHQVGDLTLQKTAKLISRSFRNCDIVGRLGGDEFIVLMTYLKNKDEFITKVDDLVRMLHFNPNITIPANVSFSVGGFYNDGNKTSFDELYKKADIALYRAKEDGKNRFTLYGHDKKVTAMDDTAIIVITRNRGISEIFSLVSKEINAKFRLVTSTDDLNDIDIQYKNEIHVIDISNTLNYEEILSKTVKSDSKADYIICVDEFDNNQMLIALKYAPQSILTIPTSIAAVRRNVKRFISQTRRYNSHENN